MNEEEWLTAKEPVWLLKNGTFHKAIVESINNDIVICLEEDGNYAQTKKQNIYQRNPAYKEFNPHLWDLMDTDLLNEPEVLKTLKLRLLNNRIYTFVQNSVISVNPYTPIKTLYLEELKEFYVSTVIEKNEEVRAIEPHIYSIAAKMLGEMQKTGQDQAVIISGESGAGKTQANKELLRFLQYYFHRSKKTMDENIDNILSLSNPILQAFGNSKTIRNNNSSRFGKYLSLSLNQDLDVKNVKIFNYLLEKSRIISRAENEQNFHIFYELLLGLSKSQKMKYFLCHPNGKELNIEDFTYLRTKNKTKYEQHPEISFQKVKNSLITLQKQDAYEFVCRVLSAVLLLGNLIPYQSENEDLCKIKNEEVLDHICELLQIKKNILSNALTCYPIKIGSEILTKYFNARQVQELINSLAKILYQKLFQWIINQINAISSEESEGKMMTLGFLDIYGFEILSQNSLEQLFINYTNQRLHQIYLNKIFKEEEMLFKKEGLASKFKNIPYQDNITLLEMIDYEQLSIFNLLDEWCSVASPDDSNFITKLRHKHKKHPKFPIGNFNLPSTMFLVRHSPKDIEYTVIGFRDKNRDLVREELKAACRSSALPNLAYMFTDSIEGADSAKQNHKFRKFLSTKFRHEINNLVTDLIGKSNLHFIRCIKSNSQKAPLMMEDEVAFNQICYLGILDTIKLKKIGYCVKLSYQAVDRRYQWLVRYQYFFQAFPKEIRQKLTQFLPRLGGDDILYGNSMVFFKEYAYISLNKKYSMFLNDLNYKCQLVQKNIRAYVFSQKRKRFKESCKTAKKYLLGMYWGNRENKIMKGMIEIQRNIRGKLNFINKLKRMNNILIVQAYVKKTICRKKKQKIYTSLQKIINLIQRYRLRKNVQKYAIVNTMKNMIMEKMWVRLTTKKKNAFQRYMHGFNTRVQEWERISIASYNTHRKMREQSTDILEKYLNGYGKYVKYRQYLKKVNYLKRVMQSWLYRQRFMKLRRAAIIIQRAYRQYYFNKNTAKDIFDQNFGDYQEQIIQQNMFVRDVLHQNAVQNSLTNLYSTFLGKFRDKCSIFYILLDLQTFVGMEMCYPGNSWLINYYQVVKETLEKDNPIQILEVGQTYTIAANTNKMYLWGMNEEYQTYQNVITIKSQPHSRLQKVQIVNNQLDMIYQEVDKNKDRTKDPIKSHSMVSKEYIVENGKLFQCKGHTLKQVKMPQLSERVVELACGANHTIFRTSARKIYTFGFGKYGQLGHNNFHNTQTPKPIEHPDFKNYQAMQVAASYNSCVVLLSNKKLYWWGSNGSIDKVATPTVIDTHRKFQELGNGTFAPLKIQCSWTRTCASIGLSVIQFNGKLANNIGLRNKIHELIISKWQEHDIASINPPFYTSFSDYLEECHVKLPRKKVNIEPDSRKTLKKLEEKVSLMQSQVREEFSFSNHHFK